MTKMVSIDQLRANLAEYLEAARRGETIEITTHDRVIAKLSQIEPAPATDLAEMVASGAIEWSGGRPHAARVDAGEGPALSDIVVSSRRRTSFPIRQRW